MGPAQAAGGRSHQIGFLMEIGRKRRNWRNERIGGNLSFRGVGDGTMDWKELLGRDKRTALVLEQELEVIL